MTDINFIRNISNINKNVNVNINSVQKHNEQQVSATFKDILNEKCNEKNISFSKHANERIEERNIDIGEDVTNKLNEAVLQAKDKGMKNVLVMMENAAFIVSTVSNKVITAVNSNELKENIFTNIDGAVIK